MSRYLPAFLSALLYLAIGAGCGMWWWAATGRTDMPWWLMLLLVAGAGLISELVEHVLRASLRRQIPHRRAHARPRSDNQRKTA
ncbi:hypothetical protein ACWGOK_39190 [Streptomyces eurythermus]